MKRFDIDQFMTLTMVLATAGAVGAAVYSTRGDDDAHAAGPASAVEARHEEPFPEAEPDPPVKPAERVVAASEEGAAVMPALDAAPEVLDELPGPQVESATW
jgi:hypothetical protein